MGFSVKDDGTGYELHPVTIAGNVATVRLSHFSAAGVAQMVCGAGVTSAVGLAACARMNQNLTEAAVMVEDLQDFPMPVRVLLAAEIIQQLRIWMNTFILPELRTAANPANTDPTVHYFMLVALREKSEVEAILQLTEMLDPASGIAAELTELGTLVPAAIDARRLVANQQCLQDKPNYRTHLNRIIEIAALAETLALPVDPATHGVTCVVVELGVQLTGVVPTSGSTFVATARGGFSDGTSLPDPLVVMLEAFDRGARLGTPTFVQGTGTVTLRATVAPLTSTGPGPRFDLLAEVPELGLSRRLVVDRPHRVLVTSSAVTATKLLRAGSSTSDLTLSDPARVTLPTETLESPAPLGSAVSNGTVNVDTNPAATTISGQGTLFVLAADDARSRVSLSTRLVATLRGNYLCRFDLTTTEFGIGATTAFTWRVLRNGVPHFVATSSRTVTTDCDDGAYAVELDTSSDVTNPPPPAGSSSRTYDFTIMVIPKIGP
jgi:hypothetical protein